MRMKNYTWKPAESIPLFKYLYPLKYRTKHSACKYNVQPKNTINFQELPSPPGLNVLIVFVLGFIFRSEPSGGNRKRMKYIRPHVTTLKTVILCCYHSSLLSLIAFRPLFLKQNIKLDLESIGSSLGIDSELIWAGLEWSGPDIIPGLYNRHLIIEGHRGLRRW